MLVFTAENAHEKTVIGKLAAQVFESPQIGASNSVSGESQRRIDLAAHANHQCKRQVEFAASRQDCLFQKSGANIIKRKLKGVRQGNRHIDRAYPLNPGRKKSADFVRSTIGAIDDAVQT